MRCPKCSYISFDKVTSCVKCSANVTEIAHALNGTAFNPLGTFYLGTLLPNYAAAFGTDQVASDFSFDNGADDLNISMDAMDEFGDVPDLPGDFSNEDFSNVAADFPDFGGDEISLDGHQVPDMDLSSFDSSHAGHSEEDDEDTRLDEVPDFDLSGIELEEDDDLSMAGSNLELERDGGTTPDLSDIDLSLGEDELAMADEDEFVDLGELELEKEKSDDLPELPDLQL